MFMQAEVRQMLVRDGLLQPLLQALTIPGLNKKSVSVLSYMAKVCNCWYHFISQAPVYCTAYAQLANGVFHCIPFTLKAQLTVALHGIAW
jgi:hypothetical protein